MLTNAPVQEPKRLHPCPSQQSIASLHAAELEAELDQRNNMMAKRMSRVRRPSTIADMYKRPDMPPLPMQGPLGTMQPSMYAPPAQQQGNPTPGLSQPPGQGNMHGRWGPRQKRLSSGTPAYGLQRSSFVRGALHASCSSVLQHLHGHSTHASGVISRSGVQVQPPLGASLPDPKAGPMFLD